MRLVLILSLSTCISAIPLEKTSIPVPLHRTCSHRFPTVSDLPHHVTLESDHVTSHRVVKRSLDRNLRIKVFFHESVEDLSDRRRKIVTEEVVPEAVKHWERVLKVRSSESSIRLNRKCQDNQYFLADGDPDQYCKEKCVETKCGEFLVPKEHLESCRTCDKSGRFCEKETDAGPGVSDADFILYVSALPTKQCGETIGGEAETVAYAAHCQQESALDRPVAGHTNICPLAISDDPKDIQSLTSTVKHELLHALGFSSSLFAFYRDKDGKPLTKRGPDGKPPINHRLQVRQWSDKIIKQVKRPWKVRKGILERTFNFMVTPKVVQEVRAHFNCPTLIGAELEDQGGDGTSLTHWEKRLFQNEAMTGTVHTQDPVYSRVTFALLEDTGWYLPDYSLAHNITWGKDKGCDFALKSCLELMEAEDIGSATPSGTPSTTPFCRTPMHTTPRTFCTQDGRAVGSCNLVQYEEEVPEMYQNFIALEGVDTEDIGKLGSSVTLADFCPYIQEFTWKSDGQSKQRGTNCQDPTNRPAKDNNYAMETYGEQARCFEQGRQWEQESCRLLKQWRRFGAGCYSHKCESGRVKVILRENATFDCVDGKELDVALRMGEWLHSGSIVCPRCLDVCEDCSNADKEVADQIKENLKEECGKTSFQSGKNDLLGFLKGFGINLDDLGAS